MPRDLCRDSRLVWPKFVFLLHPACCTASKILYTHPCSRAWQGRVGVHGNPLKRSATKRLHESCPLVSTSCPRSDHTSLGDAFTGFPKTCSRTQGPKAALDMTPLIWCVHLQDNCIFRDTLGISLVRFEFDFRQTTKPRRLFEPHRFHTLVSSPTGCRTAHAKSRHLAMLRVSVFLSKRL